MGDGRAGQFRYWRGREGQHKVGQSAGCVGQDRAGQDIGLNDHSIRKAPISTKAHAYLKNNPVLGNY